MKKEVVLCIMAPVTQEVAELSLKTRLRSPRSGRSRHKSLGLTGKEGLKRAGLPVRARTGSDINRFLCTDSLNFIHEGHTLACLIVFRKGKRLFRLLTKRGGAILL